MTTPPTVREVLAELVAAIDGETLSVPNMFRLVEAHRVARAALATAAAGEPTQLQVHQNAFWNKHGMPSMLPSSCFKCGHVGEPSTTHSELPNVYICKACVAAPPDGEVAALIERLLGAARHWGHDRCGSPETCPLCEIADLFREAADALARLSAKEPK